MLNLNLVRLSREGIQRIEEFHATQADTKFDPMLSQKYRGLSQDLFTINVIPEATREISDIEAYNNEEGLALNAEEVS